MIDSPVSANLGYLEKSKIPLSNLGLLVFKSPLSLVAWPLQCSMHECAWRLWEESLLTELVRSLSPPPTLTQGQVAADLSKLCL